MIDTSSVNLLSLIPGTFKKVASTGGGEYHGACPFCGGKDRFVIQPHRDRPSWWCRRCDAKGDAIAFVQQYRKVSFVDAIRELQLDNPLLELSSQRIPAPPKPPTTPPPAPALVSDAWQDRARSFVDYAYANLMNKAYPEVNEYLFRRWITPVDADLAGLGYNPADLRDTWGGTDVYLPQGIVIPYFDKDGSIRKINVRRGKGKSPKYLQIKGGANWLYNAHRIHAHAIVVMVEGEFDAISISIGTKYDNRIVPVATGSTTGARWLRWAALLTSAHRVLLAFDDDDAGDAAAKWWSQYLPNSRCLIPDDKDTNAMLINGKSIRKWIEEGLKND